MNKKLIIALVMVLVVVFVFVACKNNGDVDESATNSEDTTIAEITTDEDGFMDIIPDDSQGTSVDGEENTTAKNDNNGGNSIVITPGDVGGEGFVDIGDSNGGFTVGDGTGSDSIDWDEIG